MKAAAKRARSAITGRFVTKKYAKKHTKITLLETVKKVLRRKKK